MLRSLGNLILPTYGRSTWVGEARVFCVAEELLHGFGLPFHGLVERQLILLDQSIDMVYSRHLEIISTVDALSFVRTPCDHPTLFTRVRRR